MFVLPGLMQETPLELRLVLERGRDLFPRRTVTTRTGAGFTTATYAEVLERAGRLASTLRRELGVQPGDRIGTLAWNAQAHLEVALAVPGMGAVLHTINARLDPGTISALVAEAADSVVFVDRALLDVWEQVDVPDCVRKVVLIGEAQDDLFHPWVDYENLIAAGSPAFAWPSLPESAALGLCFTSGTIGRPKGVLYSHRSTVLHAMAMLMADGIAMRERDVCLPIVQLFHANAWGFPYAALLAGSSLAFAGKASDPHALADIIEHAGVTVATAVPTVWAGLLDAVRKGSIDPRRLASLDRLPVGGAVASEKLIAGYAELGIRVMHCWGMTEISPLGTVNGGPKTTLATPADRHRSATAQGLTLPLCATRIVDDAGNVLPRNGRAVGELQITGPWVARGYFDYAAPGHGLSPQTSFVSEGHATWLRTGDLATIDAEGYVRIVDRTKDLIKSGGEWISSVALEAALMDYPDVLEAAVIGRPHPKWDERPIAYIVGTDPDRETNAAEILSHLAARFAKWQLPDAIIVVASLPKGATGKIDKGALRRADAERQSHLKSHADEEWS